MPEYFRPNEKEDRDNRVYVLSNLDAFALDVNQKLKLYKKQLPKTLILDRVNAAAPIFALFSRTLHVPGKLAIQLSATSQDTDKTLKKTTVSLFHRSLYDYPNNVLLNDVSKCIAMYCYGEGQDEFFEVTRAEEGKPFIMSFRGVDRRFKVHRCVIADHNPPPRSIVGCIELAVKAHWCGNCLMVLLTHARLDSIMEPFFDAMKTGTPFTYQLLTAETVVFKGLEHLILDMKVGYKMAEVRRLQKKWQEADENPPNDDDDDSDSDEDLRKRVPSPPHKRTVELF